MPGEPRPSAAKLSQAETSEGHQPSCVCLRFVISLNSMFKQQEILGVQGQTRPTPTLINANIFYVILEKTP